MQDRPTRLFVIRFCFVESLKQKSHPPPQPAAKAEGLSVASSLAAEEVVR
jgi:hypothetical protein